MSDNFYSLIIIPKKITRIYHFIIMEAFEIHMLVILGLFFALLRIAKLKLFNF
tara:strand:+ start:929 stop:1087 length:159 start_codon:yes stop_codon:yes gene_type:complete